MTTITFTFDEPVFVDIEKYPAYQISDHGQVRRKLKTGFRYITPYNCDKHLAVSLSNDWGQKTVYVHRLVLTHFGPSQPSDMPLALHIDDDPANNRLDNIVWGDKRMNANMAVANGRWCPHALKTFLTRRQAEQVRDLHATGKYSMRELAKQFGCSRWTISNIVHNRFLRSN